MKSSTANAASATFWSEMAYPGILGAPGSYFIFVWNYTYGRHRPAPRLANYVLFLLCMLVWAVAMTNSHLEVRNLTKRYGDFVALGDISLDVADGEFVCFLGPSGCGKTTLLRAIAGLDIQTSGRIFQG